MLTGIKTENSVEGTLKTEWLFAEQVKKLSEDTKLGMAGAFTNAAILVVVLWSVTDSSKLLLWLCGTILIIFPRLYILKTFKNFEATQSKLDRWKNIYLTTLVISGLIWGSAGFVLFPSGSVGHQSFIAFVLGGMVAGSIGVFSVMISAFLAYSLPALLPIAIKFYLVGDQIHFAMGLMISLFWILMFMTAKRLNKDIIRYFSLKHDKIQLITDLETEVNTRKDAESKLLEKNKEINRIVAVRTSELFEANKIINRSPAVAFLWKNLEGWPVEFVSDNVAELFGYSVEAFTSGQVSYASVIHPDDLERIAENVATYSNEKESTSFVHEPYRIITKDGNVKWIDDRTYIRRDNKWNITHYEGVVIDVTARMQAAKELQESQKKLARSKKMESLGLLAGGVAHDLNNVLSGIVSYPELLLLNLPQNSKLRKPIETIQESGHRAVTIVQDLLTVARGVATTKEPLQLNNLIKGYLCSPEFEKLKLLYPAVNVKTDFDAELLNIRGSHVHILKVVMNLVLNAFEALEDGGNITLSTTNRYIDKPLNDYDDIKIGEYAILAVSDDGSGISPNDLERVFEPFYTKKIMGRSGTGLGLAVVWNVVQDHKGYINVTTDEHGTTFELYFLITRDEISDRKLSIPIKNYKGNGEVILVVDDMENQRVISCNMLNTIGYKAIAVSSGEEAVEFLKENTVNLILLDMIMDPGISGRETYERVIQVHPKQKAIIVSGFAETNDVKETQKLGAGRYVKKPLTLDKIGPIIRAELEK
jgi:two-component system, cell cycle sensor histidine kinase and response regulator CckA